MEFTLINKDTASIINPGNIVQRTDDNVIVNTNDCWKLVTNLQEEKTYPEYFKEENPDKPEYRKNHNPALAYSDDAESQYTENLEYRFGFHNLFIGTKKMAPVSGAISMPINVTAGKKITITCTILNSDAGSVEFYIVDNTDEIPIMPNSFSNITREQLFFGLPTRFIIDQNQPVVLYEDNVLVSKDYTELSAKDFQDHLYTISYIPLENVVEYIPTSDKIRIKVIIRQYDTVMPIAVKDLVIHKYGEALQWNLNQ